MNQLAIVTIIFLITYVLIVSEKIHRTVVALAGALLVIMLGIMPQQEAFHAIDFNVDLPPGGHDDHCQHHE